MNHGVFFFYILKKSFLHTYICSASFFWMLQMLINKLLGSTELHVNNMVYVEYVVNGTDGSISIFAPHLIGIIKT